MCVFRWERESRRYNHSNIFHDLAIDYSTFYLVLTGVGGSHAQVTNAFHSYNARVGTCPCVRLITMEMSTDDT